MTATLYHNPRCSKSRQAKALLDERGVDNQTRLYLQQPLSVEELSRLFNQLNEPLANLVRSKEAEYKTAGLTKGSDRATLIAAVAAHPKLLERPILTTEKGARLGRPPERILEIL
ncbi:MAG: arsenate reductase (glutaredoxin) [Saccharospirillum sp.]